MLERVSSSMIGIYIIMKKERNKTWSGFIRPDEIYRIINSRNTYTGKIPEKKNPHIGKSREKIHAKAI